jgi:hypothetical protein
MLGAAWCSTRIGSLRAGPSADARVRARVPRAVGRGASVGSESTLRTTVLCLGHRERGVHGRRRRLDDGDHVVPATAVRPACGSGSSVPRRASPTGSAGWPGGVASDAARWTLGTPAGGYGAVFVAEAVLFVGAAWLAARSAPATSPRAARAPERGDAILAVLR